MGRQRQGCGDRLAAVLHDIVLIIEDLIHLDGVDLCGIFHRHLHDPVIAI